ncbi:hypothetical protein Q7A53_16850 [Halobacillus rhizosphaerae]|uniref:hypothetical protein n=1 Tax=Halobacillus rhizosphaerae TaxID=3064889 RepID=UPI00398A5870
MQSLVTRLFSNVTTSIVLTLVYTYLIYFVFPATRSISNTYPYWGGVVWGGMYIVPLFLFAGLPLSVIIDQLQINFFSRKYSSMLLSYFLLGCMIGLLIVIWFGMWSKPIFIRNLMLVSCISMIVFFHFTYLFEKVFIERPQKV